LGRSREASIDIAKCLNAAWPRYSGREGIQSMAAENTSRDASRDTRMAMKREEGREQRRGGEEEKVQGR
jgi:hypothetical protein